MKKLRVLMLSMLLIVGCAPDNATKNIEKTVNMLLTAPDKEYNKIMNATQLSEAFFIENYEKIRKNFVGLIEEKTLDRLLHNQTLITFYQISYENKVKIEPKTIDVHKEDGENNYTFKAKISIDDNRDEEVKGVVQLNDKDEITYLKFNKLPDMIK